MTTYTKMTSNQPVSSLANRCLATAILAATAFSLPVMAAGSASYKAKCAGCHGVDGAGTTVMGKKFNLRDLRGADVQKRSDEDLAEVISKGKPSMPAFGKTLDAAAVQELVAHIRSIATK